MYSSAFKSCLNQRGVLKLFYRDRAVEQGNRVERVQRVLYIGDGADEGYGFRVQNLLSKPVFFKRLP
jgi:hypothetical protein